MKIEDRNGKRCAVLSKIVRVPVDVIYSVKRSPSGAGAVIVTDRGSSTVADDYDEIMAALYGDGETR